MDEAGFGHHNGAGDWALLIDEKTSTGSGQTHCPVVWVVGGVRGVRALVGLRVWVSGVGRWEGVVDNELIYASEGHCRSFNLALDAINE